jgi:hypothetical protein
MTYQITTVVDDAPVAEQTSDILDAAIAAAQKQQTDIELADFTFVQKENQDVIWLMTSEGNVYTDTTEIKADLIITMLSPFI